MARLQDQMPASAAERFDGMLARRLDHEPLQYILGYTEFYGLRLEVTPAVLIPRPETEQVVEEALRLISDARDARVLDVGTGSACIALAIKSQRPDVRVWACDISSDALEVAASNAAGNRLDVQFFRADALADDFADEAPAGLDLLVSNPPYVSEDELETLPKEVAAFEPPAALFSRSDPIAFYRRLGAVGWKLLKKAGYVVFETHAEYGRAAADVLSDLGYEDVELLQDYSARPRILRGRRPNSAE